MQATSNYGLWTDIAVEHSKGLISTVYILINQKLLTLRNAKFHFYVFYYYKVGLLHS